MEVEPELVPEPVAADTAAAEPEVSAPAAGKMEVELDPVPEPMAAASAPLRAGCFRPHRWSRRCGRAFRLCLIRTG